MPRPLYQGQPIPYTAAVGIEDDVYMGFKPDLKHIDETRMQWCVDMDACLLCGEHVGDIGAVVWDARAGVVAEDGVMHDRCGRIALAHCPHLRDNPYYQLIFGVVAELVEYLKERDWPNVKSMPASWTVLVESRASRTA